MQPSASRIKAQRKLRGRKASQSICLLLLLLPFAVPTETWQVNSPLVPGAKRRRRLISDPATEDMLYEIERVRRFSGISLKKVPDETTILNFRHLLERHGLGTGVV